MTVAELINALQKMPPDQAIMILDGFNGGGCPREINVGPGLRGISQDNSDESADCEDRVGEVVVVLGFGSY